MSKRAMLTEDQEQFITAVLEELFKLPDNQVIDWLAWSDAYSRRRWAPREIGWFAKALFRALATHILEADQKPGFYKRTASPEKKSPAVHGVDVVGDGNDMVVKVYLADGTISTWQAHIGDFKRVS